MLFWHVIVAVPATVPWASLPLCTTCRDYCDGRCALHGPEVSRCEGGARVECMRGVDSIQCNPGTLCSQNSYVITLQECERLININHHSNDNYFEKYDYQLVVCSIMYIQKKLIWEYI